MDSTPSGNGSSDFCRDTLQLDAASEITRIVAGLRTAVHGQLRRQGAVVGISGGLDSSVVLALCCQAFGAERVTGVIMPERESSPDSAALAWKLAHRWGVEAVEEEITATLEGHGCYRRRDQAIADLFPGFGPGWKAKIRLPGSLLDQETLNIFYLTVIRPDGCEESTRIPLQQYRQIVAASNFKQRARMAMLYYHGELRNYAVVGTANKNEHGLGFFVKHGDGGVDVQPIGHLFKSQVYQLADHLTIPPEICHRTPTTDTYSAGNTQQEFFFRVPFEILDPIWHGYEQGVATEELARELALAPEQVERVIADIVRKQRTTEYLRRAAIDMGESPINPETASGRRRP